LLVLLGCYFVAWASYGRDPEAGTVVAQWEPPDGLSPGAIRYVRRMGYDDKCFAASLTNLAVKGRVRIDQQGDTYTVTRLHGADPPPDDPRAAHAPEEERIIAKLFQGGDSVVLGGEYVREAEEAVEGATAALEASFSGRHYFAANSGMLWLGMLLMLALAAGVAWITSLPNTGEWYRIGIKMEEGPRVVEYLAGGVFGLVGLSLLFGAALPTWKQAAASARTGGPAGSRLIGAFMATAFSLIFAGLGLFIAALASVSYAIFLLGAATLTWIFAGLLKAYSPVGRKLLDRIEGLRLYLSVGEADRLAHLNPPERTPQVFERYLPYAMALDVERQWGEQFADVLGDTARPGAAYEPGWYSGSDFTSAAAGGFAASLGGTMSSAISSSSTAPGSSSGSDGGGSSGGGGGGGGGGGW
jgi:uncharacterized membrane protein YgcG